MKDLFKLQNENRLLRAKIKQFTEVHGCCPFIEDTTLKGGFRVVRSIKERDEIDYCLRKQGMRVVVIGSDSSLKEYRLISNGRNKNEWEEVTTTVSWDDIQNKPLKFPPSPHEHSIEDIDGLEAELENKAELVHSHNIADVTGLEDELDSKQDSLISGTNIKTVNGESILGSGNIVTPNTTYSAGTGISLSGTTFGQTITTNGTGSFVTGITQTSEGFQVNLGTPPNTIPNDGILTLDTGAGLSGSATFSANQSTSSTFTVGIASGYVLPTTAQATSWDGKQNAITGAATTIISSNLTANRVLISNGSGKVAVSATTATELGYLSGVTSSIQTQLNDKISSSLIGANNGIASLGSDGKINSNQLPALAITETFPVSSQAQMLALTAQKGDVAIRSDINKTFILREEPASTLANWEEMLMPASGVQSVAMSVPTGFTISGSPITSTGTLALSYASGYQGFTTAQSTKLAGIEEGANNYTLPNATKTILGGIKLFSDTVQSVASNAVSTTVSRTYGLQVNSAGEAVVNVPWVNTTYSAGSGLTLSGTTFSLPITISGTGSFVQSVAQNTNGITVTLGTPPNTTYTGSNGINVSGTVISPTYGTTAGTIAQGNDSRINNGQTAYDWGDFRDYGLGINPTITNADLITESGFFSTSNAHAFGYGSGIHLGRYEPSGVRAGQLHIENAGSGSEPVVKVRMHNSSGWGTIRTLWHDGNLRSDAQNDARYLQLTGGTVTGTITAPTFSGALSGNATTATRLATARTINGVPFNGSTNIVTTSWGSGRDITIGDATKYVNGSTNISWSLSEIGALPLTGGAVTGVIKSPAPVADEDLANKAYVDSKASPFNIIDVTQQSYTDKAINVIPFNNTGMSYSEGSIDFGITRGTPHTMGVYAFKQGLNTTALGMASSAFGFQTVASGNYSSAFGRQTTASNAYSSAFGSETIASGQYSSAFGDRSTASGFSSSAFGGRSTASGQYSSAFGNQTTASGHFSSAFGTQTTANEFASLAIGRHPTDGVAQVGWVNGSPIFKVGNGTSPSNRRNAYVLYNDGRSEQIKDMEVTEIGQGFVLKSPDGTRWRITVDNSGNLTATSL